MSFDTAQIQFWLTVASVIFIPLVAYVLRQQENRSEARDNLLRTEFKQHISFEAKQDDALQDELRQLQKNLSSLLEQRFDALKYDITELRDADKEHHQQFLKLHESHHKLELKLAREYSPKVEVAAELKSIESKIDRVHNTLNAGLRNIHEKLQAHELNEARHDG